MRASAGSDPSLPEALQKPLAPVYRLLATHYTPDPKLPAELAQLRLRRAQTRLLDALLLRGTPRLPSALRRSLRQLALDWARQGLPDSFAPLDQFELEAARSRDLLLAEQSGDRQQILAVLESAHRRQIVEQYGRMELKGLPLSHTVQPRLHQVYVPLRVQPPALHEQLDARQLTASAIEGIQLESVLPNHRCLLLTGAPGSGKSTLVQYLATRAAEGQLLIEGANPLPLVLLARTVSAASLAGSARHVLLGIEPRLLSSTLPTRPALLLVDGLDELAPDLRDALLATLAALLRRYKPLHLLLTSRPQALSAGALSALGELATFTMAPMDQKEIRTCIDRWCLAAEISASGDTPEARRLATAAASDLKARVEKSSPVQRIAANPLLTTILCLVHRFHGQRIPERRFTLYERCTDVLLYDWDHARLPHGAALGKLDAGQKRRLLQSVARRLQQRHATEIEANEVRDCMAALLPDLGLAANDAASIVQEIQDRSGLLLERRPGFFSFSHLTFQEYLTALDFAANREIDELIEHVEEPWWEEVFALTAAALGSAADRLVRRLLALKSDAATKILAMSLQTAAELPVALRERIRARLVALIPPASQAHKDALLAAGTAIAPDIMAALASASPEEETSLLSLLLRFRYEPAVPLLSSIARRLVDFRVTDPTNHPSQAIDAAFLALLVLEVMRASSSSARTALEAVTNDFNRRTDMQLAFRPDGAILLSLIPSSTPTQDELDSPPAADTQLQSPPQPKTKHALSRR